MQHNSATEHLNLENYDPGEERNRYLIFSLGTELYGAPLVSITEVMKVGSITPVPFMTSHFKGIINLRGQILSVIDLRMKFGITPSNPKGLILILDSELGKIAAIVDDAFSVSKFELNQIDEKPPIQTKIPSDFLLGVGIQGDRLINLVDISKTLSAEDYRTLRALKEAR